MRRPAGGGQSPIITSNGGAGTANVVVPENSNAVTTVIATDPDTGQQLSFSIVGGTDAGLFTINSGTGALSFATSPNFEVPSDQGGNNVYDVTVQVSDGNGGIDTQVISVTVSNVNEAPTDIGLSATTVPENAANGALIGNLSAVDPDAGDSSVFALLDSAGGRFAIANGNQLVIGNGALLDYEAATSHAITVQATDAAGATYSEVMTISLNNVSGVTLTIPLAECRQ